MMWSGMMFQSWLMLQASDIWQSSSTGPSKNACSSAVSVGTGADSNLLQFGFPLKISPSHQTVPASIATCSVSEIGGRILRIIFSAGLDTNFMRTSGIENTKVASVVTINNNAKSQ